MNRIDLQQFCGKDDARWYLMKPFRLDENTYATNGHIVVRVEATEVDEPLVEGTPLTKKGIDSLIFAHPNAIFASLRLKLPARDLKVCESCGGDKIWKDDPAPGLYTTCEGCDGIGYIEPGYSVSVGGVMFAAKYLEQISALPDAEFPTNPLPDKGLRDTFPTPFRFRGGSGALMPMRGEGRGGHFGDLKQFMVAS